MATASTAPPSELTPTAITSVQPGGGFCMNLELAFGRFRRAYLRKFYPEYVLRMAEKRQGQHPDCPHDIIDSRDLKYFRNVCGFWFKPEDDPFRWREYLGLARMGLGELVCFSLVFGFLAVVLLFLSAKISGLFWIPLVLVLAVWAFIFSFFRDPHRVVPADPTALVSPADGTITHVGEVAETGFPNGRAFRISIFLSVFNVHVNRTPRAGRVAQVRYFPGAYLDARAEECSVRNEQLWIDYEEAGTGRPIRVKQIAGAIARRIVCWLKPGDQAHSGERFGMIKFGSRTEVFLPADTPMELLAKVGDKVKGGSTILLKLK